MHKAFCIVGENITSGLAVLVIYRPVDESTMCTTTMGPVMRESSGSASVEMTCTLASVGKKVVQMAGGVNAKKTA